MKTYKSEGVMKTEPDEMDAAHIMAEAYAALEKWDLSKPNLPFYREAFVAGYLAAKEQS